MNDLDSIKLKFEEIRIQLGFTEDNQHFMEFLTTPRGDGTPHIEIVRDEYHFVVSERGCEYERRITQNEDDILYWLVSEITQQIAVGWECKNRIPNTDSRIGWMKKDIEILRSINPSWADRKSKTYYWYLNPDKRNGMPCPS